MTFFVLVVLFAVGCWSLSLILNPRGYWGVWRRVSEFTERRGFAMGSRPCSGGLECGSVSVW